MAVETITIGELVSRISFIVRNDTSPSTALRTEIVWAIDSAVSDFLNEFDHPAFQADGTITVVASTADYDLADDFQRLLDGTVRYTTGSEITLVRVTEQAWHSANRTRYMGDTMSEPCWYDLIGRDPASGSQQIRLLPTPSAGATIAYKYIATPHARDSATDAELAIKSADDADFLDRRFPPEMHQYIVEAVVARYMAQYVSPERLQQAAAWIEGNARAFRRKAQAGIGHTHSISGYFPRSGTGIFQEPGTLSGYAGDIPS